MLSDTLAEGLERYRIGPKIKALRTGKELGLAQLGEHTGLSPAMLSKIERSQLFPTLPTLLRIALVFGVGLEHFFTDEEKPALSVVRRGDRLALPNAGDGAPLTYLFESLDFPVTDKTVEAFAATFPMDSEPSEPHRHAGTELIYVIEGQLGLKVGEAEASLDKGDAVSFDCGKPHSYRRLGRSLCKAIVVVTPA